MPERPPPTWEVRVGDAVEVLRALPEASAQMVVTSPPYYGLRDYGTAEWDGGDPTCEHRGLATAADAVVWDKQLSGAHRRARPVGAPQRGGNAWLCSCGARRIDSQIGLEPTVDLYIESLVAIFREAWRVLRDDGTDATARELGVLRRRPAPERRLCFPA